MNSQDPRPVARVAPSAVVAVFALLAIAGASNRWGSSLLAVAASVLVLLLVRRAHSAKEWMLFSLAVLLGHFLSVAKIVTEPIPFGLAPLFALPIAIGALAVALAYRFLVRRAGEVPALYGYAALCALLDWFTSSHTPLGTWGTAANSQLENLAFLQLASLFGVGGIAFLLGLAAAALALSLDAVAPRRFLKHFAIVGGLVLAAHVWGSVRIGKVSAGPTVTAAAVITDVGLGRSGLPSPEELRTNEDVLFERTALAARRGARLVVWNEVATVVEKEDEPRLRERGSAAARTLGVDLVLAYGVVLSRSPLQFLNRYAWLSPEGAVLETYEKHHPVPGEPSVRGEAPLIALTRPFGRAAGAICYDYDFPAMAREHASLHAGLVFVPSSDWLGVDPTHTLVTRVRAIEAGVNVLRPVRWATSAAFDAYGRTRTTLSPWDENDRVMLAVLPVRAVPTLYARWGDVPLLGVCGLILAACLPLVFKGRGT